MNKIKLIASGLLLALSFGASAGPKEEAGQAEQYVGYWQVTRIMQPHKLPYYPRDCSNETKIRQITALGKDRIQVSDGAKAKAYDVGVERGQHYTQSTKRRQAIDWVVSNDTFLHSVGYVWEAYRRCDTPPSD